MGELADPFVSSTDPFFLLRVDVPEMASSNPHLVVVVERLFGVSLVLLSFFVARGGLKSTVDSFRRSLCIGALRVVYSSLSRVGRSDLAGRGSCRGLLVGRWWMSMVVAAVEEILL